jgi:hypothetical protein
LGQIKTYARQRGFRKSEVQVVVRSPEGKERTVLLGEVEHIRPDRRIKKRHNYLVMYRFSHSPNISLTYCLDTQKFSLYYRDGFHAGFCDVSLDGIAAILGCMDVLDTRYRHRHLAELSYYERRMDILRKWHQERAKNDIRKLELRKWQRWRARHRMRAPNGTFATNN